MPRAEPGPRWRHRSGLATMEPSAAIAERFVVPATSTSSTPAASSARPPAPVTINACSAAASGGGPLVLEADEQERGKAGELPEHEQREDVVAEDHAEHRAHERE